MRKPSEKTKRLLLLILLLMGIFIASVSLYLKYDKKQEASAPVSPPVQDSPTVVEEKQSLTKEEEPQQIAQKATVPVEKDESMDEEDQKDPCLEIEAQIKEFFLVLNEKPYIKEIDPEIDTYQEFIRIIKKLAEDPPSPAGEGLDPRIMAKNIFYFFRVLDDTDLRLIQEIVEHEQDTLEMNLVIFYKWLMLGDQCPDPDKIRPSFPIVYSFSGFFINTIGGKAYLFRRSPQLRQLVNYYALLILHEADKRGDNIYGIDILPDLHSLIKEMGTNPDLILQPEYMDRLNALGVYYQNAR
jgi:hypothetical protein